MKITKKSIKDALFSIVRIENGKIYGDKRQVELFNDCNKYPVEWEEIYKGAKKDEQTSS